MPKFRVRQYNYEPTKPRSGIALERKGWLFWHRVAKCWFGLVPQEYGSPVWMNTDLEQPHEWADRVSANYEALEAVRTRHFITGRTWGRGDLE